MSTPLPIKRFIKGMLYYPENDFVFDSDNPTYNYFVPDFSGKFCIIDCWVCDIEGNVHPHYLGGAVPIESDCISVLFPSGKPVPGGLKLNDGK